MNTPNLGARRMVTSSEVATRVAGAGVRAAVVGSIGVAHTAIVPHCGTSRGLCAPTRSGGGWSRTGRYRDGGGDAGCANEPHAAAPTPTDRPRPDRLARRAARRGGPRRRRRRRARRSVALVGAPGLGKSTSAARVTDRVAGRDGTGRTVVVPITAVAAEPVDAVRRRRPNGSASCRRRSRSSSDDTGAEQRLRAIADARRPRRAAPRRRRRPPRRDLRAVRRLARPPTRAPGSS